MVRQVPEAIARGGRGPLTAVIEEVLATPPRPAGGKVIGSSREDRPILGWRLGGGETAISLIGGCHADEPVGPDLLRRLCAWLGRQPPGNPLLTRYRWSVVPHVNPDGEDRNRAWSRVTVPVADHRGADDRGFDLATYLFEVVRELPGDDVEFGFPRDAKDSGARVENRAVARFLAAGAPYALHASLHGMGFAPGVWFLLEEAWEERTRGLRRLLAERAGQMG